MGLKLRKICDYISLPLPLKFLWFENISSYFFNLLKVWFSNPWRNLLFFVLYLILLLFRFTRSVMNHFGAFFFFLDLGSRSQYFCCTWIRYDISYMLICLKMRQMCVNLRFCINFLLNMQVLNVIFPNPWRNLLFFWY